MASRSEAITAWRIVKKRYASSAFDGEGARRYGGRWNTPGTPVVYLSDSRALAMLEVLAGLRSVAPLPAFAVVPAVFDASLVLRLENESLPAEWRQSPPHPVAQRIGDAWVGQGNSAILRVPSVIVPEEYNYLLNPAHPEFHRIRLGEPQEVRIDPRLLS
jgi:RES domain-containing protein